MYRLPSTDEHHYLCQHHPTNIFLSEVVDSSLPDMSHRDGTIRGFCKWLFDPLRCDKRIDKLQEALDRL